uniref:Phosphoribosylaminoimidazole-succinocarboxamide synthase, chloroplastic n=1 Tax=Hyaloperonospora arabidopsidis (strain Emoy2) TaxID=559515 RepID=M4C2N7_HYAAE
MTTTALVAAVEKRTQRYLSTIETAAALTTTSLAPIAHEVPSFRQITGKVRDIYVFDDNRVLLVSTDRQSAFDRALASVPFKGRVLTLTSVWWFTQTQHIIANHVLSVPHASAMLCKKCFVFPVEFVVRGYITGSTSTSLWTNYRNGSRTFCGHSLQDGYKQHQKLPENLVTPTTKDEHDELISGLEIVQSGRMTQAQWTYCEEKALALFAFGQEQAAKRGLILVDTKYEFGVDNVTGEILLVDEIHTPDSSRYWLADTYEACMAAGKSPDNIDKEFLRLWFKDHCDPYNDAVLPEAPKELVSELARRYIMLYELITDSEFGFPAAGTKPEDEFVGGVRKSLLAK